MLAFNLQPPQVLVDEAYEVVRTPVRQVVDSPRAIDRGAGVGTTATTVRTCNFWLAPGCPTSRTFAQGVNFKEPGDFTA